MQRGTELDLPYLTMDEDAFSVDPFPHFAKARAEHPWLARWTLGYVVTDYQAMRDLFSDEAKLGMLYDGIVEIMEAKGTPWGNFQQRHMLSMTGETHKRVRDILAPSFTPRQANMHRGLIQQTIRELLDEWAPKGQFDFEEFASYFPITVMCRLIGADPAVIPSLRSAMEAIGLSTSMDKRWLPAMQEGVLTMERFTDGLIADRRAGKRMSGEPDLLDLLLEAQAGGGLSDRELGDVLIFLFVAGYDTSKNMLTLIMCHLISRPEIYRKCAEDLDYCRKVVEEAFRYTGTATSFRATAEDIVFRDVLLPKDTMLFFPIGMASRDPGAFEDPERFDPERNLATGTRHVAFGLGKHMCLGQYIARAQLQEALHQVAQRIRNPRLAGEVGWRPFFGAWGLKGLPIAFDLGKELEPA